MNFGLHKGDGMQSWPFFFGIEMGIFEEPELHWDLKRLFSLASLLIRKADFDSHHNHH